VPNCNPHAVTATITAEPPPPAVCTAMQNVGAADCFLATTDAGIGLCNNALGAPDGSTDPCGNCVFTNEMGPNWGAFVVISPPLPAGATGDNQLTLFNVAGCIAANDTSTAAQACATALEELSSCEFAACVAYCPVASTTDTAGIDALLGTSTQMGCLDNAATAECMTQVTAVNSACATETNDAGTGTFDKCNALATAANASTAASPAGLQNYIGSICGGADAGI